MEIERGCYMGKDCHIVIVLNITNVSSHKHDTQLILLRDNSYSCLNRRTLLTTLESRSSSS